MRFFILPVFLLALFCCSAQVHAGYSPQPQDGLVQLYSIEEINYDWLSRYLDGATSALVYYSTVIDEFFQDPSSFFASPDLYVKLLGQLHESIRVIQLITAAEDLRVELAVQAGGENADSLFKRQFWQLCAQRSINNIDYYYNTSCAYEKLYDWLIARQQEEEGVVPR